MRDPGLFDLRVAASEAATATADAPSADIGVPFWAWIAFVALIVVLLILDLKVFHRESHAIEVKEAAWFSAFWIALGLGFTLVVLFGLGGEAATQYLTGYLIEKSLSVDNVFVWAVIFTYFAVPAEFQHRTLFWGIFGALVLRAAFIFAGVALLENFSWIIFVFGGFLVITAVRLATHDSSDVHPERNPVLRLMRRFVPMTSEFRGQRFFVKEAGKRLATPLFAVLVLIEVTDVIFAVDSIPAILAITQSEFIVFTSNAFAILGLRALYFLLAGVKDRFVYLNYGLAIILAFVGVKMIISMWVHLPPWISLAVIAVVLTVTIAASLYASRTERARD